MKNRGWRIEDGEWKCKELGMRHLVPSSILHPLSSILITLLLVALAGCGGPSAEPELIYGKRGVIGGEFIKPRAVAIDTKDRVYIVDYTARIQVFQVTDRECKYLNLCWTTPDYRNGRPSGLSIDRDGNLLVSDSHYNCLRIYSPEGKELRKIGGEAGTGPGQFSYISDAVQDSDGFYYVAEFGELPRISKLDAEGRFVCCWGSGGQEPGQFSRIRAAGAGTGRQPVCRGRLQPPHSGFHARRQAGALLGRSRQGAGRVGLSL